MPNDPWPLPAGGCHCLLDAIQHEFRRGFHATGEPVEVRLVDGCEAFLTSEIQREGVVGDVLDGRYQVVCRRQLGRDLVSALKNYRLDQFSVERLMEFLTALNQDVEIMILPRANTSETGHISVLAVPSL